MALVLDTGPILALMVASDRHHAACLRMVHVTAATLVVPAATLVEVDYWVRKRLTPEVWRAFVEDVGAGAYRLEAGNETDLVRVCETRGAVRRPRARLRGRLGDRAVRAPR